MYNSIFIGLLMRITRFVQKMYKNSFLHRILFSIKTGIKRLYFHSKISKFNKNIEKVFKSTKIYFVVGKIWDFFDWILNGLFNIKKKLGKDSVINEGLAYYSNDLEKGLRLVYESSLLIGILTLITRPFIKTLSLKIIFIFLIIGIIGLLINGREKAAIKNSKVMNFLLGLFTLDEGGENWW